MKTYTCRHCGRQTQFDVDDLATRAAQPPREVEYNGKTYTAKTDNTRWICSACMEINHFDNDAHYPVWQAR